MATYSIKKVNNGEYKEIEKHFKLDLSKFVGHSDTLYFDVEGEKLPVVFEINLFSNIMIEQIQKGLMESLDYDDGSLIVTTRDGNTIKRYTYDFSLNELKDSPFNLNGSSLEELKRTLYMIVSFYNESPNHALMTEQKYLRMILDIMDGDRLPTIENQDEILRVFQVYHANKGDILTILLENVVFYDDNDNVLEYGKFLRARKLEAIKYDVLNQMEIKMLMFAVNNNAFELYQDYNGNTYIPRVEIEYKYVDEEGNEIEAPVEEVEAGTLLSVGKEMVKKGARSIKNVATTGASKVYTNASELIEKTKQNKRTKR